MLHIVHLHCRVHMSWRASQHMSVCAHEYQALIQVKALIIGSEVQPSRTLSAQQSCHYCSLGWSCLSYPWSQLCLARS